MRDRRQELINYCCKSDEDRIVFVPLIEEAIFLEKRLEDLKKLPFIKINPKNPAQKQYKELLQQYTNVIKVLTRATGQDEGDEESPLRKWVRKQGTMDSDQSGKG